MDLFAVTQSLLEFSIERFDKYIVENPLTNLYTENESKLELGVCELTRQPGSLFQISTPR